MMNTYSSLPKNDSNPHVLTIGTFDGVHRGHQEVLRKTVETAKELHSVPAVLTFSNHPAEILRPDQAPLRLISLLHRLKLIEAAGIKKLYVVPFTYEFSQQTAEEFLEELLHRLPIKALILGYDSAFGRNREGTCEFLKPFAKAHRFDVIQVEEKTCEEEIVSSRLIRQKLREGHLAVVEKLLNRPYSLFLPVQPGKQIGKTLGFPTLNFDISLFAHPPLGVYAVTLTLEEKLYPAVANLGTAPTVRQDEKPTLEVHALSPLPSYTDTMAEITFYKYLREEKKFSDLEALKKQIAFDSKNSLDYLSSLGLEFSS